MDSNSPSSKQKNSALQARIDGLRNQAELHLEKRNFELAAQCYKKILSIGWWRRGVDPRNLFEAHIKLGEIYAHNGKILRSTSEFKRALALAEKEISPISPEASRALEKLMLVYEARGQIEARREVMTTTDWNHVYWGHQINTYFQGAYRRSWGAAMSREYARRKTVVDELLQQPTNLPADLPGRVALLYIRARFARWNEPMRHAEALTRQAYKYAARELGPTDSRTEDMRASVTLLTAMSRCLAANDIINDANVEKRRRAMALAEQAITEAKQAHERVARFDLEFAFHALATIGLYYAIRKRYDEAQPFFEQTMVYVEKHFTPDDNEQTYALCNLAQCAYYQGRYEEAERYDLRALAIREKAFGEKPATGHILDHLIKIYEKQGSRQEEIERLQARVKAIREEANRYGRWEYDRELGNSYRF